MSNQAQMREQSPYREARREELLKVSARLIADKGFARTTVRDIADASGLLSGSLYYYFRSKEEIVEHMVTHLLDFLWKQYDEIRESDRSPREKLETVARVSLGAIHSFNDEVRIYQNEGALLEQRFHDMASRSRDFHAMVTGFLKQGIAGGEFREDLNPELAFRFIRDSMWPIVHWYRPGGRLSIDAVERDYLSMLFNGIATPQAKRSA